MSLISIKEYEEYAEKNLNDFVKHFLLRGSQNDVTLNANLQAFKEYRIIPRYMRDVSKLDLQIKLFGDRIKMPIAVSPMGMHDMYHPNGELETARGVREFNTVLTVSVGPSITMEDIAANEPDLLKWFQLFIYKDRQITADLIQRAELCAYKALVLTIDMPVSSLRVYVNNQKEISNFRAKYSKNLRNINNNEYKTTERATDVSWSDLRWIKSLTRLPVVVKGVLSAEDARLAVNYGADAVLVSNHGGRQLDDTPATLEVLPEIVKEIGNEVDVFMDGGVRSGNDVFKALAIGAKAVFIGRPVIYGLIHDGHNGVKSVLDIFYREFESVMQLSGCGSVADITQSNVKHIDKYRNQFYN